MGIGHGEYFALAIQHTDFEQYRGIDISPTCVQMCREMIGQRFPEMSSRVEIKVQDFFQYGGPACDAVVLGEILEHVEDPRLFLDKVYEITDDGAFIYITTVVNCPQKDHIYLFCNVDEIEELYGATGFEICDRLFCPTNGYTFEKAVNKKTAIITAHILKRR